MINDPEISAMSNVYEAMKGLDIQQMKRIFNWLTSKFGLVEVPSMLTVEPIPGVRVTEPAQLPQETNITQETHVKEDTQEEDSPNPQPVVNPEPVIRVKRKYIKRKNVPVTSAETNTDKKNKAETNDTSNEERGMSTKGFGLKRFKTIENLFLSANTKTVNARILLAAAFLQEKLNFTEISSFDINSRLKKMGYGVTNITTPLYSLLKKNPPWLEEVQREGGAQSLKKKFIVTEEGLRVAKSFLKGTDN